MKVGWTGLMLLAGCFGLLFAAPVDGPAAMVNLIRPEIITQKQLQLRFEETEEVRIQARLSIPPQTEEQVLDAMIAEILIRQAAERDGISVTPNEINTALENQRRSAEAQLKQQGQLGATERLTQDQFQNLMEQQTRMSWDEIRDSIRKQITQQKYMSETQSGLLDNVEAPTEVDIRERYRKIATSLVNPEIIRFSQIFISTVNKPEGSLATLREKAEEAHRKLRQGEDFSSLVTEYTDDNNSRYSGGDFGYLARNDARAEAYFGEKFFSTLFELEENQVSDVLRSNIGYHIVKVREHIDAKILSLDDQLSPTNTMTVREYIGRVLMTERQQQALQKAYARVVSELRQEADIQIFE
jgi:peptidyl-prolyl cis-trans isomerase SurA